MTLEQIKTLIKQAGESGTIELKRSTANLKSAAQTLCAFLNGQGGSVFIGVSDSHQIIGQAVTNKTKLDISNILKKLEPTANITVEYVDVKKGTQIIVLTAHPDSRCVPYCFSGAPYERQQADTNIMPQTRYQQLLLMRNMTPVSWEKQIAPDFSVGDLDKEEIRRTIKAGIKANHFDPSLDVDDTTCILTKLGLLKNNQLLNAAVVLFAKNPSAEYMQCTVRMARFKGLEKGDFLDSKHVFGHAFSLLTEAERFIQRNTAVAGRIKTGKMEREDLPEYPVDAVREALINALVHRDYTSPGGAITLTIYDNRLELINTGLLPAGISLAELKETHTSHPRNPKMINIFYRRGLIEEMGMGTQEILKICADAKMKEPEFFEQAGTFVIRLWSRHYEDNAALFSEQPVTTLSERQSAILVVLKANKLAPNKILEALKESISERTLRRDLQTLKDNGYINSEGSEGWARKWFLIKR